MSNEAYVMIDELPQLHNNALQLQQPQALLHYSNHASNDARISTYVMIHELHQVHSYALQLQQPQELLDYSNHASNDVHIFVYVMIGELRHCSHSNHKSCKVLSITCRLKLMIDKLPQVHDSALQLQQPHELLHYSNHASNDVHISTYVMIDGLHQVHTDALQLQQPQELLHYSNHASNGVHISTDVMIDELHQVHIDALQLLQPQELQSSFQSHVD